MDSEDRLTKALAEVVKQQQFARILEPPILRAAREMASSFKLSTDLPDLLKVSGMLHDALAMSRPPELRALEVQPLRLKPIDIFDAKPIALIDPTHELVAPLREFAASIQQQQEAIARALGGLNLKHLAPLRQAAELARHHYEAESSALAMVQALEATETKQSHSPDLIEEIVRALVGLVVSLAQRTKRRVQDIDLLEILYIIVAVKALLPDPTAQDVKKTLEIVARLEESVRDVVGQRADQKYVESLPRRVVITPGRVRDMPNRRANIRTKLATNTVVAIAEKRGRWRHIIYLDNLTGELDDGWVWSGSLRGF